MRLNFIEVSMPHFDFEVSEMNPDGEDRFDFFVKYLPTGSSFNAYSISCEEQTLVSCDNEDREAFEAFLGWCDLFGREVAHSISSVDNEMHYSYAPGLDSSYIFECIMEFFHRDSIYIRKAKEAANGDEPRFYHLEYQQRYPKLKSINELRNLQGQVWLPHANSWESNTSFIWRNWAK